MPPLSVFPARLRIVPIERDPEMHQTKKGPQWYFGMKAHVAWTDLLHGQETRVRGDTAYSGQREFI